MKTAVILSIITAALAAPTKTVESRQLPGLGGSGSSSGGGLASLASLIPHPSGGGGLGSLLSGGSSGSSSGGGLSNLLSGGSSGSSSGGLPDLSSLLGGGSSSSSDSSDSSSTDSSASASSTDSSSGSGSSAGSSGGLPDIGSLLGGGSGGSSLFSRSDEATKRAIVESTKRAGLGSITENDVANNKGCKELTFIFARGTTEMGNMGSVVGPPVAQNLNSLTGNKVAVQGVDYPASAEGNAMLGAAGGPKMASLVQQALKQCPKTKVVLGGYSQGAMVVHNAASKLSAGQISGAVLFGDPFKAQAVGKLDKSKTKEFCASGDPVCENGFNVMAHLTYGGKAKEAAQFLVQAAGVSS
ncbi:carbohydrate esterase family 5 protein [Aspergillus affinis]|uniref:carbohydrate esterase family 5 protein n=1 Tax=Aspergillus affinis TaxID=1070780 RepID=UPI0022FE92F6|nr:cutinase-domain-containing protein [Aspergillus affinis]KAI9041092.1 cutinase-domain-containing protein [Aspergillus affinis]